MPQELIRYQPIGIIKTPYKNINDMPIQPVSGSTAQGELIIYSEFCAGLMDLDGFSHVYLIYHFHQVQDYEMIVTPFLDEKPHGIFATRAPKRPNPIGLSIVKLVSIEENVLIIDNVDMLDGTPILDIKPYVPAFDQQNHIRLGWLTGRDDDVSSRGRWLTAPSHTTGHAGPHPAVHRAIHSS